MPDISLDTLEKIPHLRETYPTSTKQNNPNNCGAYALIAAVGAHGVFPTEGGLHYENEGPESVDKKASISEKYTYPQLSAAAYEVTGILNNKPYSTPELLKKGNVYSSPAAMAKVAVDLGMQKPEINVQNAGLKILAEMYPGEVVRCEKYAVVNKAAGDYKPPDKKATHIVLVKHSGGLHWLAQGTDKKFYNPDGGILNNDWTYPKKMNDKVYEYEFMGLWMVIRKK